MLHIQRIATEVVTRVLTGRNLTDTLGDALKNHPQLTPQQRGAIRDLSYGTLRHYSQLDAMVKRMVQHAPADKRISMLLMVAIYQLRFTDAAPYAIVDHAVKLVTRWFEPGKGLVNAVLRRVQREGDALWMEICAKPAVRYALPDWWLSKWQADYPNEWQHMAEASLLHPPMTLRVNLRKTTVPDYLALLADAGLAAVDSGSCGIHLVQPVPVDKLPHFHEGWVSVQDAGAQAAAGLLQVKTGMRVLDACAAPGGKTGHLLETADIGLVALDQDAKRLERVQDNLQRLGLTAELKTGDASQPDTWWNGIPFDRILLDVPCSASGVVRRNPDIKWHRLPKDIAQFCKEQADILRAIWPCLKPGGKLLYATCSVFPEENQQQIEAFLKATPDARLDPITDTQPCQQWLPAPAHDGFFYARLEKIG